jgi:hypothetical protein
MKKESIGISHLHQRSQAVLEPRKSFVQARSAARVDAVLDAKERRQNGYRLTTTFLEAKTRDVKASVALYPVSSDEEGAKIAQEMGIGSDDET